MGHSQQAELRWGPKSPNSNKFKSVDTNISLNIKAKKNHVIPLTKGQTRGWYFQTL